MSRNLSFQRKRGVEYCLRHIAREEACSISIRKPLVSSQKARDFYGKEEVTIPEVPNSAADDWALQVPTDHIDDLCMEKIEAMVNGRLSRCFQNIGNLYCLGFVITWSDVMFSWYQSIGFGCCYRVSKLEGCFS